MAVLFSRPMYTGPRTHSILGTPSEVWDFELTYLGTPPTDEAYKKALGAIAQTVAMPYSPRRQDIIYNQLRRLEHWQPRKSSRGRPKGSGARFRDAEDFHQTVVCDLRHLLANGFKDTQQELACLWYERDNDPAADVDSLVSQIKRYCSRDGYGIPWKVLQAEARRR